MKSWGRCLLVFSSWFCNIVVEAPPGTVPIGSAGSSVQAPVCAPMPTMMSSAGMVMPMGSCIGYSSTTLSTGLPYPTYQSVYQQPIAGGAGVCVRSRRARYNSLFLCYRILFYIILCSYLTQYHIYLCPGVHCFTISLFSCTDSARTVSAVPSGYETRFPANYSRSGSVRCSIRCFPQ